MSSKFVDHSTSFQHHPTLPIGLGRLTAIAGAARRRRKAATCLLPSRRDVRAAPPPAQVKRVVLIPIRCPPPFLHDRWDERHLRHHTACLRSRSRTNKTTHPSSRRATLTPRRHDTIALDHREIIAHLQSTATTTRTNGSTPHPQEATNRREGSAYHQHRSPLRVPPPLPTPHESTAIPTSNANPRSTRPLQATTQLVTPRQRTNARPHSPSPTSRTSPGGLGGFGFRTRPRITKKPTTYLKGT